MPVHKFGFDSFLIHVFESFAVWAQTQAFPEQASGLSAGAGSPFSNYVAGVAIYMFIIGVLVTGVLVSAFLIVNLGLLSKRPEDRTGSRTPSDLGVLKSNVWPEAPYYQYTLPPEEEGSEEEAQVGSEKQKRPA